ncbi:MAG: phosphatase PAP2 family protein [Clostridia bacterium]|nr:phosphatase PAP2 family protein [Clostridia bacterium]
MNPEISFLNGIQEHLQSPGMDIFFKYYTHLGEAVVFIALAVLLIIFKKTRKIGVTVLLALTLGTLIGNLILKNVFARPRPYNDANALIGVADLLIKKPSDYSFPSGHTLAGFNTALVVFYYKKIPGAFALLAAALLAFSRMYLYVHYPTDIIGGFILAVLCSVSAFYMAKAVFKKQELAGR